jgi:hypothetical protein
LRACATPHDSAMARAIVASSSIVLLISLLL